MPIMNGRRVSLAEWRAAKDNAAKAEVAIEADAVEEAAPEEKPQRRRRASRANVAAQVQAALGITPEATGAEDEPQSAPAEAVEGATEEQA